MLSSAQLHRLYAELAQHNRRSSRGWQLQAGAQTRAAEAAGWRKIGAYWQTHVQHTGGSGCGGDAGPTASPAATHARQATLPARAGLGHLAWRRRGGRGSRAFFFDVKPFSFAPHTCHCSGCTVEQRTARAQQQKSVAASRRAPSPCAAAGWQTRRPSCLRCTLRSCPTSSPSRGCARGAGEACTSRCSLRHAAGRVSGRGPGRDRAGRAACGAQVAARCVRGEADAPSRSAGSAS